MAEGELGRQVLGTALAALAATGLPLEELGCTLLFYACGGGRFLAGHLGDGLMALVQGEDCRPLSLPENGENPSETWFVTSPDALEHLRLLRGDQGLRPAAGKAQPHPFPRLPPPGPVGGGIFLRGDGRNPGGQPPGGAFPGDP